MKIEEQLVLVTGAARGLGQHIARAFAAQGAQVIINYHRSSDAARALAKELGGNGLAVQADVTDRHQVDTLMTLAQAHFGRPVTTVINNAMANYSFNGETREKADTISWSSFQSQFDCSVRGALNTVQAAVPGMRAQHFGRIINIGTNLIQDPVVAYHDFTAAKAALLSLTRTLAGDLGPDGITVNMVSGGLLRMTDASAATPEAVFDFVASATPLGSVTTPAELADATLIFASPWSRAVTGQNLVVDGGLVRN